MQSLANKTDILLSELSDFDTISVPESCWLDPRTSEDILLHSYNTYKRDRERYKIMEELLYVNKNVFSKRRNDLQRLIIEFVRVKMFRMTKTIGWNVLQTPKFYISNIHSY